VTKQKRFLYLHIRPYFEALESAKKAQKECQAAATAYQRAFGVHAAAKVNSQGE
jgi:hypothetical protein